MKRVGPVWVVSLLLLFPALAQGQTFSGLAEVSAGRGASVSAGESQHNESIWQGYSIGFASPLFSPRFLKFNTELSFRTGRLSFLSPEVSQKGSQKNLGYKLGATLFPAGRFPFFVQASRDNIAEAGDYPSTDGIRGGIVVPAGEPSPQFRTRTSTLALGWQLNAGSLPRFDVGYRKGESVVTGGPYRGDQRDEELHLAVSKDTATTQQSLRYQRNNYQTPLSRSFDQQIADLDYSLGATIVKGLRTSTRIGRRTQFSMFEVPSAPAPTDAYQPLVRGKLDTVYAVNTVSYQPTPRVGIDVTANLDRQKSTGITTNARLATGTAHVELVRGLSINAMGTYGVRGQVLGNVPTTVVTRSGLVGGSYRAGVKWLEGNIGYLAGVGSSSTPDGRAGTLKSWAGNGGLSVSARWFSVNGGYERSRNRDDILDFGNYDIERGHAAIQTQAGRFTFNLNAEQSLVERGRAATYARNLQRSFSGSVSVRLNANTLVSANAGGFRNDGTFGRDQAIFAGASLESQLLRSLHLSAWIRRGDTTASLTRLDQRTLYGFAQLEYRLRQFGLALEYRHNEQHLLANELSGPYRFRGHQVLVRVSRKFGGSL